MMRLFKQQKIFFLFTTLLVVSVLVVNTNASTPTTIPPPPDTAEAEETNVCDFTTTYNDNTNSTCVERLPYHGIIPGSIGSLIQSMLKTSQFVYTYGTIRKVVKKHDININRGKPKKTGLFKRKTLPLVDFYKPNLIMTQMNEEEERIIHNTYMKHSVSFQNILEFLKHNRQYLKQNDIGGNIEFQHLTDKKSMDLSKMYTEKTIESLSRFDGEIVDYMDKFTNKYGLVYAITLNRTMKRITVVFRGTVGGTDFLADANFSHDKDVFSDLNNDVKVHSGFASYLFKRVKGEERTKYDRIVAALKEIYENDLDKEERDEYKVVVTGHSLGGALANLFGFTLSVREGEKGDCPLFRYIRVVTFAGPVVGNTGYDNVFREQELKHKLHMIRVSNRGDLVPTNPTSLDYTQNGVNMHVKGFGKEMELKYGNMKTMMSQMNLTPLKKHKFPSYTKRIFQDDYNRHPNMQILDDTFDNVYQSILSEHYARKIEISYPTSDEL
jgi:hypothetical protein